MGATGEARPRYTRPRFYDLCMMYNLSLQDSEKQAGVSSSVVEALFVNVYGLSEDHQCDVSGNSLLIASSLG